MTVSRLMPRLLARSRRNGDCIEVGNTRRYVSVLCGGVKTNAHRVAYIAAFGPIPSDMVVRHRCDNPNCINPTHLELGTQRDNVHDRDARGRNGTTGEDCPLAKLTETQVREIERRAQGVQLKNCGEIGADYGVCGETVYRIAQHRTWKHLWR